MPNDRNTGKGASGKLDVYLAESDKPAAITAAITIKIEIS